MTRRHLPATAEAELDAAGIEGAALRAGYTRCRTLASRHGRTYFLATLLLPPAKRPHVHALYGLARHTDDLVDETPGLSTDERTRLLDEWVENFLADLDWGATSDPVSRAAIDTVTRLHIPTGYLVDFFTSMRSDLTVTSYATDADLEAYMWGSAAVIGLQMLPVLGRRDDTVRWDQLEPHAIELGVAFQLTNFLRDIADDLRRGRVYLPQERLDQFDVDRERLARAAFEGAGVDESIRNLLAWQIERTRERYAAAAPGIELVHPTSQDCLRTALTLYAGILDEIEAADYDVFSGRLHVSLTRRARVGLRGLGSAWRARRATPVPPIPTASG